MADGLALLLGGSLGLLAGYFGGRVDALIMRIVDVLLAFPYLLLALIIVAVLRAKPDQFGDRDRHHLYTAICAADAWAGADGADSGFRGGGTGDRGRASARDAASRAAEQLHARAGAGHAAVRSGGGGE